jgi:hypothetical protein
VHGIKPCSQASEIVDKSCCPPIEFAPVGGNMAASMCRDVHHFAAFVPECFSYWLRLSVFILTSCRSGCLFSEVW